MNKSTVPARIVPSFELAITEVMATLARTGEFDANTFIGMLVRNGYTETAAKFKWSKERKRLRRRGLFLRCKKGLVFEQRDRENVKYLAKDKARLKVVKAADEQVDMLADAQMQPGITEEERSELNEEERRSSRKRDGVVREYLKHERHKKQWPSGLVEDGD